MATNWMMVYSRQVMEIKPQWLLEGRFLVVSPLRVPAELASSSCAALFQGCRPGTISDWRTENAQNGWKLRSFRTRDVDNVEIIIVVYAVLLLCG